MAGTSHFCEGVSLRFHYRLRSICFVDQQCLPLMYDIFHLIYIWICVNVCICVLQIRVRFVTTWDKFRISDAPFAVPSHLGRIGLSEVVNHLLNGEEPQPFDFLVDSQLLRTTLAKFLTSRKLSAEGIILVEYMPALTLSDKSDSIEVPAWIGSLDTSANDVIYAGCYDGQIQILDSQTLSLSGSIAAHETPIRSLTSISNNIDNNSLFPATTPYFPFEAPLQSLVFTGSRDQKLKCWAVGSVTTPGINELSHALVANFNGHVNSVESLCVWNSPGNNQSMLLSGDWSGNVFGWNLQGLLSSHSSGDSSTEMSEIPVSGGSKKKQKGKSGQPRPVLEPKTLKPTFTIRAHAQSVSGLLALSTAGNRMLSSSWDHSIKEWDIEQQDCVHTFAGSKVATSIDFSYHSQLIASSHPDGKIRLWDTRAPDLAAACIKVVGSSSNVQYVSQV